MILKGSKRGGSAELARHLLKAENEHVEVYEVRGFAADTVFAAFKEAQAISRGTKCRQFLFSLSLSPPELEPVPMADFETAIETIEVRLGLSDQPRVIVFHEKEGRRHAHCVWSRINGQTMTAIDQPHFKLKLQEVSRALYIEHGWKMPDGMIDPNLRNPLNFTQKEWFQAKRTKQDPRDIKAVFQQCWAASDSGKAFRHALEQKGYFLARGDRRAVVAIDVYGEVYAASRWIGVRSKDVTMRIGDREALPTVDAKKAHIAGLMRKKLSGFIQSATDEFTVAAQATDAKRAAMVERHQSARRDLRKAHDERRRQEVRLRSERYRKGLMGLWDRVSGKHGKLRRQNESETAEATRRDAVEKQALIERQLQERQRLQREIRQMRVLHLHQVTRLNRHIAAYDWREDSRPEQLQDTRIRRRQRREPQLSGP